MLLLNFYSLIEEPKTPDIMNKNEFKELMKTLCSLHMCLQRSDVLNRKFKQSRQTPGWQLAVTRT